MPRYLYRGDSDPCNHRQLREVYPFGSRGYVLSNLSNGGSGQEIFNSSLVEAVNRHVHLGWSKTHFLSFSESHARAMTFAAGPEGHTLNLTYEELWDGAVITIDTRLFSSWQEVEPGIYRCTYHGRMMIPEKNHLVQVLLIDVVSYLQHQIDTGYIGLNDALEKATQDSEWLILPLDPSYGVPGELTSKLDDGCISDFERYRFEVG